MNFYELSVRTLLSEEQVRQFLAARLGVDLQRIGSEADYWDRLKTSAPLMLGLTVLGADEGYRTLVRWVQDAELSPGALLTLAAEAARAFVTEVAIADVVEPTDFAVGQYLIVSPDGRVRKAFETENSARFELQPLPGGAPLDDVLRSLRQPGA